MARIPIMCTPSKWEHFGLCLCFIYTQIPIHFKIVWRIRVIWTQKASEMVAFSINTLLYLYVAGLEFQGKESQRYTQCRSALPPMNTLEGTPYRATDMTMIVLLVSPESHSRKKRPITQRPPSGLKVSLNSAGEVPAASASFFLQFHWRYIHTIILIHTVYM